MFDKLFSPIRIRDLLLPHRIVLPAMGTKFSGNDCYVTDKLIDYHVARVKGGSGLNIVEVASVHTPSAPRHFLSISDDKYIPGLKRLTDAIHKAGGNAGIQLWQGSLAVGMDLTALNSTAPTTISLILSCPAGSTTGRMSTAEAWRTGPNSRLHAFVRSARTFLKACLCS